MEPLKPPETQALAKVSMSQVMAGKLAWDPVKGQTGKATAVRLVQVTAEEGH